MLFTKLSTATGDRLSRLEFFIEGSFTIIIALFADEVIVKNNLSQANEVFIPSIAIGELCYGARKSRRTQANLAIVDELVANSIVLECDAETARHYGVIKNDLRLKGRPLPENDIWIAALAFQHNLILVTKGFALK